MFTRFAKPPTECLAELHDNAPCTDDLVWKAPCSLIIGNPEFLDDLSYVYVGRVKLHKISIVPANAWKTSSGAHDNVRHRCGSK